MPTHGSVAKSQRLRKEQTPEFYCPARNCLWRTYNGQTDEYTPCPKGHGHGLHVNAIKREEQ